MSVTHIQQSIDELTTFLSEHPDKCRHPDKATTAVLEEGLRCRVVGPKETTLVSDMPKSIGGGGSAPTPSWFLRAALATCETTVIAMRAAQVGVALTTLAVTVESESDDRGILGMDNAIAAGPLSMRIHIRIGAEGIAPERLREIVSWAQAHSPVGDAIHQAVPSKTAVEIA